MRLVRKGCRVPKATRGIRAPLGRLARKVQRVILVTPEPRGRRATPARLVPMERSVIQDQQGRPGYKVQVDPPALRGLQAVLVPTESKVYKGRRASD